VKDIAIEDPIGISGNNTASGFKQAVCIAPIGLAAYSNHSPRVPERAAAHSFTLGFSVARLRRSKKSTHFLLYKNFYFSVIRGVFFELASKQSSLHCAFGAPNAQPTPLCINSFSVKSV